MKFVTLKSGLIISLFYLMLGPPGCSPATQLVQPVRVQGIAMEPGLKEGDRILLNKDVTNLKRGDVVAFYYPKDQSKGYIKRVIGLPDEEIEVREGRIYVNGKILEEPYVAPENNQSLSSYKPVKVAPGNYYVLGDNRDHSSDSRYWGTVPQNLIYGKFMNKY